MAETSMTVIIDCPGPLDDLYVDRTRDDVGQPTGDRGRERHARCGSALLEHLGYGVIDSDPVALLRRAVVRRK